MASFRAVHRRAVRGKLASRLLIAAAAAAIAFACGCPVGAQRARTCTQRGDPRGFALPAPSAFVPRAAGASAGERWRWPRPRLPLRPGPRVERRAAEELGSSSDAYYREELEMLQRIRGLTSGVELSLPQIVVVGDQSAGKSSLLTELTGVPFPVDAGTCTKAPIVVQCTRADKQRFWVGNKSDDNEVDRECLAERIRKAQDESLEGPGTSRISSKEVRVYAEGPELTDIILVDLPGIINNGEGRDETRQLIENYIQVKQTLILLVSEAKQDDDLVTAMGLAKKWDPERRRTMRVLTKFDTFDSDKTRDRASSLIEQNRFLQDGAMNLAPHAVVCRAAGGAYSKLLEDKALNHLPTDRAGIPALKSRLPKIFCVLIEANLPILKADIQEKLAEAERRLRPLGEEPMGRDQMLKIARDTLGGFSARFEENITVYLRNFQSAVANTSENVTEEWAVEKYRPNSFRIPLFQGEATVNKGMKEITTWWGKPVATLLESINELALEHIDGALADCNLPSYLVETIKVEWCGAWKRTAEHLENSCDIERHREVDFGTMNQELSAKFQAEEILPDEVFDRLEFQADDDDDDYDAGERWFRLEDLRLIKGEMKTKYENIDIHDQQKKRVFHTLKVLWAIEHKTFTDNIMKVVRDTVVKDREEWIGQGLLLNERVRLAAVEDQETSRARKYYMTLRKQMRDALKELQIAGRRA